MIASQIREIWLNRYDYPRINVNYIKVAQIVLSETIEEAIEVHRNTIKTSMKDHFLKEDYKDIYFEISYTNVKNNIISWFFFTKHKVAVLEEEQS